MMSRTVRIVVVLPAPFGPRNPKISRAATSSERSTMPRAEPYDFVSRSVAIAASATPDSFSYERSRTRSQSLEDTQPVVFALRGTHAEIVVVGQAPASSAPQVVAWSISPSSSRFFVETRKHSGPASRR